MIERKTIFSADRKYRYTLWREFQTDFLFDGGNKMKDGFVQFIGLNPSTADETKDDPTIRRCIGFAKSWGFGALCMTNLFAFRATDPKDMKKCSQPDGERTFCAYSVGTNRQFSKRNDAYLYLIAQEAAVIVAAWGTDGKYLNRDAELKEFMPPMACLRKTANGHPSHPLYLPKNLTPIPLNPIV